MTPLRLPEESQRFAELTAVERTYPERSRIDRSAGARNDVDRNMESPHWLNPALPSLIVCGPLSQVLVRPQGDVTRVVECGGGTGGNVS